MKRQETVCCEALQTVLNATWEELAFIARKVVSEASAYRLLEIGAAGMVARHKAAGTADLARSASRIGARMALMADPCEWHIGTEEGARQVLNLLRRPEDRLSHEERAVLEALCGQTGPTTPYLCFLHWAARGMALVRNGKATVAPCPADLRGEACCGRVVNLRWGPVKGHCSERCTNRMKQRGKHSLRMP